MYETTVCTPIDDNHLLEYIKNGVVPIFQKMGSLTVEHSDEYRSYLSVACNDTYTSMTKRLLLNSISEVLCIGYKNIYLKKLLGITNTDFYTDVLINTMCLFDSKQDKIFTAKMIDIEKPVFLDGYFNFKMNDIKCKWKEICKLVEDNYFMVGDIELTLEFLQYLLQSIDCRCKKLSVVLEEDTFYLFGTDDKVIKAIHCITPKNCIEQDMMQNMLFLNPQSICIYCKNMPSEEFVHMSKKLFDCSYIVRD